jgi:adenylate kinase family enzyme
MLALVGADYGLGVITISDMIRENIANETPIGLEYKKFLARMTNRQLMPCALST